MSGRLWLGLLDVRKKGLIGGLAPDLARRIRGVLYQFFGRNRDPGTVSTGVEKPRHEQQLWCGRGS